MDDHVPHQPYGLEDAAATVHEVAQEHRPATFGMDEGPVAPERTVAVQAGLHVPEPSEESLQFLAAPVDIADDVERAVLVPLVVPQRNTLDNRRLNLLGRVEHEDVPEALPLKPTQRTSELRLLVADDVRAEVPLGSLAVALQTELLWEVENNCYRQAMVLSGQFHQRFASLGLDVRSVDHREPPQRQPLPGDEPEHLERLVRDRLVVLVVRDHAPAGIGREDLRGLEVAAGEGALARAAGADQDEEAELGYLDLHLCVNQPRRKYRRWPNRGWASTPGSPAPTYLCRHPSVPAVRSTRLSTAALRSGRRPRSQAY